MFDTKNDIVYTKFNDDTIELTVDSRIINTIIFAGGMFNSYLKRELTNGNNSCLRDDIKRIENVLRELVKLKNGIDVEENLNINITIAEFLILKYGLDSVAKLVVPLLLQDSATIGYYDFLIHLEEKYNSLDSNEIEAYYEFLSECDA